jgi:hypothetical protein
LLVVFCVTCRIMRHVLDHGWRRRNDALGCARLRAVAAPTGGAEWLLVSQRTTCLLSRADGVRVCVRCGRVRGTRMPATGQSVVGALLRCGKPRMIPMNHWTPTWTSQLLRSRTHRAQCTGVKLDLADGCGRNTINAVAAAQGTKTAPFLSPHCDPASCCEANTKCENPEAR